MRQRRVGTFTLGITLILIGIIVPLTLIFKEKSLFILQFSPIVLVFLGIEVLIYAIKFKEDKLKYDGVSIFLVIMLTVVSIGTASIAPIVSKVVTNERILEQERYKGEEAIEKAFNENGLDATADVYPVNYNSMFWIDRYQDENMEMSATAFLHWEPTDKIPTKDEIADKVTKFVEDVDFSFNKINIKVICEDFVAAKVNLDKNDLKELTRDRMLRNIRIIQRQTDTDIVESRVSE